MDASQGDSKMSLWGEFEVAAETSEAGKAAPPSNGHPLPTFKPSSSTSLNTSASERIKTLSTDCNSKEDLFKHLLRLVR